MQTNVTLLHRMLDLMLRLDGRTLMLQAGATPYVLSACEREPQDGTGSFQKIELSTRTLTSEALGALIRRILPEDRVAALERHGAAGYGVARRGDTFSIVAARQDAGLQVEVRRKAPPPRRAEGTSASISLRSNDEPAAPAAGHSSSDEHMEQRTSTEPHGDPVEPTNRDSAPRGDAVSGEVSLLTPHRGLTSEGDWSEEVMTELDLGELLRASEQAVTPSSDPTGRPIAAGAGEGTGPGVHPTAEAALPAAATAAGAPAPVRAKEFPGLFAIGGGAHLAPGGPAGTGLDLAHGSAPAGAGLGGRIGNAGALGPPQDPAEGADQDYQARHRPSAVVVPLTRSARGDEDAEPAIGPAAVHAWLRGAADRAAMAVYLIPQKPPLARVDGEFVALDGEPTLSAASIDRLIAELGPAGQEARPASEWVMDVPEVGRVRCLTFHDFRGQGLVCRIFPRRAITAEHLALPAPVQSLCTEPDGFVLVGGGRGSGRSTLLTSLVDLINRSRTDHVIAIESQIEFVHAGGNAFISQREVRGDGAAVAAAVRAALRERPDVLLVEELGTPEVVSLAMEAAEAGVLVLGSVAAVPTASVIERLLEMLPADRREKGRATLAASLRGIVSQVLLRRLRGGWIPAREVLLNTPPISNLILDGATAGIPAAIQAGRRAGMISFAESLAALVREGVVHPAHALRKAPDRERFLALAGRDGEEPGNAERRA